MQRPSSALVMEDCGECCAEEDEWPIDEHSESRSAESSDAVDSTSPIVELRLSVSTASSRAEASLGDGVADCRRLSCSSLLMRSSAAIELR